jgi:peptidoglycan/LPS O-acetylase OafA/YrhL
VDPRREITALLALGLLSWGLRELTYARPGVLGGSYPFEFTIGATFLWFSVGMAAAVWSVSRGQRADAPLPAGAAWLAGGVVFLLLSYAAGLPRSTAKPSAFGFLVLHGGYALIAGLLVLPFTGEATLDRSLVARVLTGRPMRRLGEVSYGVYLWHPIVIVALLDAGASHRFVLLAPLAAVASIVLGSLSYELVERPARRLRGSPGGSASVSGESQADDP